MLGTVGSMKIPEYTHPPKDTHSDKCALGQTNVPTQFTFLYLHTFPGDILSPGVNLLTEIRIYCITACRCHTQKLLDDLSTFLTRTANLKMWLCKVLTRPVCLFSGIRRCQPIIIGEQAAYDMLA